MKPIVILDRLSTSNKSQTKKRRRGRPKPKSKQKGQKLHSPSLFYYEIESEIIPEKIEVIVGLTSSSRFDETDSCVPLISRLKRTAHNSLTRLTDKDEDEIDVKVDPEQVTSSGRPKRLTRSVTTKSFRDSVDPNDFPEEDAEFVASSDSNPYSSSSEEEMSSDDEELVSAKSAKRRIVEKQPEKKKSIETKSSSSDRIDTGSGSRPKKAVSSPRRPKQSLHSSGDQDEEKQFTCRLCSFSFTSATNFERHKEFHKKDMPFQCHYCPKRFLQSSSLREHENWHKTDQPWACNHCDARFVEKLALTGHKIRRHCLFNPEEDQHKCELCLRRFEELSGLMAHIEESHGGDPQPSHHLNVHCYYCDGQPNFENKEELKEHEATDAHRLTIEGKINIHCILCRIKFTSTDELKAHLVSDEHVKERRRMAEVNEHTYCRVCRLNFTTRVALWEHDNTESHKDELSKWQLDTSEEEWLCSYCGRDFHTKTKLKEHTKLEHSQKVRQCEVKRDFNNERF
jgi:hypothetical protein